MDKGKDDAQREAAVAALMRDAWGMAGESGIPVTEALEAIWQNAVDELEATYPETAVARAAPDYGGKEAFWRLCREVLEQIDPQAGPAH